MKDQAGTAINGSTDGRNMHYGVLPRIRLGDVGRNGIRMLGKRTVKRVVFIQYDLVVTKSSSTPRRRSWVEIDFLVPTKGGGQNMAKQKADQIIKAAAKRATLQRNIHILPYSAPRLGESRCR